MDANREFEGHITSECIENLIKTWEDYDPMATGWINPQDIGFLMYELPYPLGREEVYDDIKKRCFEILEDPKMT